MSCLTHEKPFAGINGSGKHVNWSLGSASQGNLLDPGDTPHENAQFLVFCAAVMRAVKKYQGLLRAVVATAGNDHRLGANEAPPAIISIFLGDQLDRRVRADQEGRREFVAQGRARWKSASTCLPPMPKDAGDRNRTSPFAFTGNRFEFRAVGSNQSIAGPLVAMNTIVAESLDLLCDEARKGHRRRCSQAQRGRAVAADGDHHRGQPDHLQRRRLLRRLAPRSRQARPVEPEDLGRRPAGARKQGDQGAVLASTTCFRERELESRFEIYLEQYCKTVYSEANLTLEMAKTMIFPAAIRYQNELASTCANLKLVGYEFDTDTLDKITELVKIAAGQHLGAQHGAQQSRPRRRRAEGRRVLLERRAAGHGDGSQVRRRAGRLGGRRPVAAADLPGNAVHQVVVRQFVETHKALRLWQSWPQRFLLCGMRTA